MSAEDTTPGPARDPDAGLPADRPRGLLGRIVSGALSYGVVILIMWFVVQRLSSTGQVGDAIAAITWIQVVVMVLLGVLNLLSNLPPMVVTLPGLRYREAGVTNTASAAVSNTVPEGGALATGLNFAMLKSWGFRLSDITTSFLATGIWTNVVRYSLGAIALVLLVVQGTVSDSMLWLVAVVIGLVVAALVVLGLLMRSAPFATRLGRLMDRLLRPFHRWLRNLTANAMEQEVPRFRIELLSRVSTCWRALTAWMVLSQLVTALVLGVAVRMQGIDQATISWAKVMVAYAGMALASLIAPTPGGLGVAEAALIAILGAGLPEALNTQIVAAVLLFRLATWLVPIPLGLVSYLYWRGSTSWRRPADSRGAPVLATA